MTNGRVMRAPASPDRARQRSSKAAPILAVDPSPDIGPQRLLEGVESGGEHPDVPQVDLEVLESRGGQQRQGEPDDLDIGGQVALPQQLGADLQHLAGAAASLRLLPEHLSGIAQPQGPAGF